MKKLSRLLLVLTLVLLIGCTSVLLVACDDDTDQGPAPTTPSFRVSFMKNYPDSGEEDVAFTNVTVRQGRTVSAYEITEDDRPAGYDFVGWFVEKDGDENFDFATKITQNVKIYAHWTENGKSTEADLKGGVFTPEKVKIKTKEGEKEVDNGVWRYVTGANNEIAHEESRFDFGTDVLRRLKAASPKTTYSVWKDEECSLTINNDATNLVVNLKNGDNVYYIKAVAEDSKVTAVYKINVYLEPKYDVSVIRIQGNYESGVTISAVAKGQKATAPSIATYVGHTFDGWYYYSEEKRNDKGQIVDADEDSGNILVKVGDKYYLADENGNRRFAYEDANGRKVVLYNGKYYLTDKSGVRTDTPIDKENIYNRLDENGLPVYDEGKPIKVGSKTEYKWDFDINVIDREDITVFGKWTTNTYSITLKISEADRAKGAKFAKTNETELFIGGVNFGATEKAIEQLISNKIGKTTDSSRPVEKPFATFAGWYYTDDLGNEIKVVDENGNGVHAFDFAKDIDLVAKFNAVTYKLVVNANDDSMTQEVTGSNDAWPYDQKATFTANPKDGYTLVRWLLNGEEYAPFGANKSVEYNIDEKHAINKTITFTAVFAPKDINVTLVDTVDNYGKTFVVKYNSDVVLGQDAIPDVPKLSADGTKRFDGWYYIDSIKGRVDVVQYDHEHNKSIIINKNWTCTEDIELIAVWSAYKFNISIYEAESTILPNIDMGNISDNSGGSDWKGWTTASPLNLNGYRTEGHQQKFANGAPLSFTAVTTNPKHYEFKGWYQLTADGELGKDPYSTEATLTINVEEKDMTYIAVWEYKQVTINFDRGTALENETTLPEQVKVDFNAPFTLPIPQGAPSEMTFDGWWHIDEGKGINYQYTGADGKNLNDRTFKDLKIFDDYNGTITLTAKWKKINYFIIEDGVIKGIDVEKAKNKADKTFEIDFDDGVFEIADGAFKNNGFINGMIIHGNITRIGKDAFADSQIEKVTFKGNFKGLAIGAGAFRNTKITDIKLPDNVTELGENVFEGCLLTELWYSAEIPLGRLFTTENPNDTSNWYSAVQGGVTYYLPNRLTTIHVTNTATAIADFAFQNATQVTKVTLATKNDEDKPYTTEIGNYAFANTGSIEVNLGSVEIIGNAAFRNSGIATVEFIALKKLGVDAFNGTTNVTVVRFNDAPIDNVSARAFANSSIESVRLGGIKTISMSAFADSKLSLILDGESVESIKKMAFYKTKINSVDFRNVVDIEEKAFHETDFFNNAAGGFVYIGNVLYYDNSKGGGYTVDPRIVSIAPYAFEISQYPTLDLGGFSNLKYIESYAFAGNGNIVEVTLPASLSEIKDNAFKGCSSIKKINLSECNNISRIWQYAFANCEALDTITFATFTSTDDMAVKLAINDYAFSGCTALKTLNLPENLGTLDSYAFKGCTALTTVNFVANAKFITPETTEGGTDPAPAAYDPAGLVTTIGDGAFMDCTSLTTITLPYFIARIGNSAFENCTALATFTTMDGADNKTAALRTIGDRAFFGNTSLNNVDVNTTKGVNTIGVSAFENCGQLATINLSGVTRFAEGVFRNAKALKSVTMSANASIYVGQEAFRNCVTLSDITARIAAVDDGAFRNCISLRAITFVSSGIEYIGSNAFNGCVLIQKVSIPSSVVAIGDSAFDGCRGITSLTFESNETLQTIGYSAFGGCSLLTRVILPSSLVELNASAFYGCSDLTYVEFGENIQSVGEDAFALCKNGLEVRFTGKTVPVFTGDIFTATESAKISVRQGYKATFEAALGTKYTIVEYTA